MKRILLLAFALCGASGAHAAAPLTVDETLAAYCAGVWQQVGEAAAGGECEALLCLNMRVPGLADPGTGDIGQSGRHVAVCAFSSAS